MQWLLLFFLCGSLVAAATMRWRLTQFEAMFGQTLVCQLLFIYSWLESYCTGGGGGGGGGRGGGTVYGRVSAGVAPALTPFLERILEALLSPCSWWKQHLRSFFTRTLTGAHKEEAVGT